MKKIAQKICIALCENFKPEAEAVIQEEGLENVSIVAYPSVRFHLRMKWEDVAEAINTCDKECDIHVLGGACLVGLGHPPEEIKRSKYHDVQCFDMFINKSILKMYVSQGAYLLSPSWLESWREHLDEYGFNKEKARHFFSKYNTKLVLFDTGINDKNLTNLKEFADFVGLPYENLPVGLDYFKLFLEKIILEWQLNQKEKNSSKNDKEIGELLSSLEIDAKPSLIDQEKEEMSLLLVGWDDKLGPKLEAQFPKEGNPTFDPEKIGFQLFSGVESIYGQNKIVKAHGYLLNIDNIQKQGYIYFDAVEDMNARGKERPFMVGVISPKINYFESLRIREVLNVVANKIKDGAEWNMKNYWEKISQILSTPVI